MGVSFFLSVKPKAAYCLSFIQLITSSTAEPWRYSSSTSSVGWCAASIFAPPRKRGAKGRCEGVLAAHQPTLLVELELWPRFAVDEVISWMKEEAIRCLRLDQQKEADSHRRCNAAFRAKTGCAVSLAGDRHAGYLNNVFFIRSLTKRWRLGERQP